MSLSAGTGRTVNVGPVPVLLFAATAVSPACDVQTARAVWLGDKPEHATAGMAFKLDPGTVIHVDHSALTGIPATVLPPNPNAKGQIWASAENPTVVTVTPYS